MSILRNLILAVVLCSAFAGQADAQFLSSCSRRKVEDKVIHSGDEIPWVTLIKAEEAQVSKSSDYGKKSPAFTQSQPPKDKGRMFSLRFYTIQRAINQHAVLLGYTLVVPQPADLTKLYKWEINHLATFFKQGTTYEKTHSSCLANSAKKIQDGVVEIRFRSADSEHTALMLVDCRNRKLYLFMDSYKNRQ